MIIITNQSNSFKIEGLVPNSYFPDGTLNAPKNSLIAVIEGDVVSFKGTTNFNTLFATTLGELTINGVQADSENIDSLLNTTIYKINSGGGGGTGGTEYFAGQNIDISEENVISVVGINVPTKVSQLTNDSNYITSADVHTYSAGTNIDITNDVISVTGLSIPTKVSDLQNDEGYITSSDIPSIPSKTSDLTNDSGYITSSDVPQYSGSTNINVTDHVISLTGVPTEFKTINGQSITGSGNITIEGTGGTVYTAGQNIDITDNIISVTGISVPTNVSELTNDEGYITMSDIPSIPTKTSDLTNDSNYITSADVHTYSAGTNISIVDDVISVTGLNIPSKTSDLQNDSDFITSSDVPEYSGSTNINVTDHVISLTGVPTEFKTINNQSITGSGDITVESTAYSGGTNIDITDHVISVTGISVPTSASQLTNDAGYVSTVLLTQSQYDALSTEEKNDATKLYIITDAASPAFIDDALVSSGSTYSSQKIETILGDIETALSNI